MQCFVGVSHRPDSDHPKSRKTDSIHHHHPEGVVYRGFCINSGTVAVSKFPFRWWRCIESVFPKSERPEHANMITILVQVIMMMIMILIIVVINILLLLIIVIIMIIMIMIILMVIMNMMIMIMIMIIMIMIIIMIIVIIYLGHWMLSWLKGSLVRVV